MSDITKPYQVDQEWMTELNEGFDASGYMYRYICMYMYVRPRPHIVQANCMYSLNLPPSPLLIPWYCFIDVQFR